MTAQKGSLLLLKVGDGGGIEVFTTVGGLRATRFSLNSQLVDSTNKDSGAWRELLSEGGIKSISITGAGIFMDSSAEETVRGLAFSSGQRNYRVTFGNGDYLQGAFLITSYERSGDYDGEETFSITLESSGQVVFTTA